jgi:hypothetical protein
MSDADSASDNEGAVLDFGARQRKEVKELTSKIMALKKSVTKGDAKKKKAVMAEVEKLESDLAAKHKKEREEEEAKIKEQAPPADEVKRYVIHLLTNGRRRSKRKDLLVLNVAR